MTMFNRLLNCAQVPRENGLLALLVAALLVLAACDKAQLLAPTNSSMTVSADALIIPSSGSTQVRAMVLEQAGTSVQNGTTVRFTTTLGRVEPAEAQTRNGVATTTFFGDGASGIAEVRAVSGAASGGTGDSASNKVQITVGSSAVGDGGVTVRANPSMVPAAGGTVDIIASVVGANNAAVSGVAVSFTTNRGTLSATTATTNAGGEARVQLTTNREATVTASVGSRQGTVTVSILAPATVSLTASATPIVGQPMTLTVTPAGGTAPKVVVNWGDGSDTDLGIVSAERRVTHVYGESGSYVISASATDAGDTFTNSLSVTVGPRPSPTVAISTNGSTLTASVFTVTPATGGSGIRNVKIDFGDDTDPISLGAITAATTVSHKFSSANTYTVRVTQTDGSGAETSGIVIITVS